MSSKIETIIIDFLITLALIMFMVACGVSLYYATK
jgi:hypothetical protein